MSISTWMKTAHNNAGWLARHLGVVTVIVAMGLLAPAARAQQFNSDNYLTMPYGTATFVVTHGQRSSTMISSFALAPNWEFFVQAYLFWKDDTTGAAEHFSTNLYAKYMFVENAAKTGGFAVMGGVGGNPGYYQRGELTNSFRTVWAASPLTLPFLGNKVLLDLMPGFEGDFDRGGSKTTSWLFTYSTRVAIYGIIPRSAIVAEVYGSTGQGAPHSEYKAGVRWEPNPLFALAVTYSAGLDGSPGAGAEAGFILFTPRFLCRGGCQ